MFYDVFLYYVVTYLLITSVGEERAACFYYRQGNRLFLFGEVILPISAQDRQRYFCGTPWVLQCAVEDS